jgi:DNA-binding transcriptional MerR regulator
MRIGELADLVGISTRAIRHYHRVGLLPEPARRGNGYRAYSLRDAVELARVRRLVELVLSLAEVGDELADDPRVEAAARQILACIPEAARRAIRIPDGADLYRPAVRALARSRFDPRSGHRDGKGSGCSTPSAWSLSHPRFPASTAIWKRVRAPSSEPASVMCC